MASAIKPEHFAPLCKKIDTSHGRMSAIHQQGSRSTVVFLHGNSSCKEAFSEVFGPLIGAGYGVLAPDFPGHGDSVDASDPAGTYSFPGYASAINELLTSASIRKPIVVGWSLGGHVAMELVGSRPDVVGLMVIGAPPGKPSMEALEQAFHVSETTLLAGKRMFDDGDAENYARAMLGTEFVDPFLLSNVIRTDGRAREFMFRSALEGIGIDQRIVAADTRRSFAVVHGAADPFVRLDYLKSLSYGRLWDNDVQVLDGVGHAPHWQSPNRFNDLLLRFLADCEV